MTWLGEPAPQLRLESHYGDRVVPCFSSRPASLSMLLAEACARNPDGEALICGGERLSWVEVETRVGLVAAGLARCGVRSGDRVALLLGNRIEFVFALFAATRLGAITVPLGIRQQAPEIAYVLNDCGAKLLIYEADLSDRLPSEADTPALERRIALLPAESATEPLEALLGAGAERLGAVAVAEEDTAVILYTSGTTGRPKGAMLTHLGIVHSALVYRHCMALTSSDRSIAAVPLSHVTGLIANIGAMAASAGALIILPAFKAADFLALAERERMTHTLIVPAMYNLCLLAPDFEARNLSAWRIGGYGGAPMPMPTIERLAEKLPGLALMNAYGATETTSPVTMMPPRFTASHGDSVGLAVPGSTVLVMDEAGHEVPRGEVGELWVHSPSVVPGYWNNSTATAESITAGFWHSGDVGSVDAEGFVRVLDRKKDMINRGGYKVYTAEVETVLSAHPEVIECAVVAVPCPVLGERVHAFVVTREPSDLASNALRGFCAARLSDYKVPETWTLQAEALPRNANGKVIKRALREGLARG